MRIRSNISDNFAEETGGALDAVYATMNGQLVEENRGGVVTEYVPDTLGSVIKTTNSSGTVTSSTTFWPYGETNTSTGANPSNFGFVGTWGYYTDSPTRTYIRARDLRMDLSRWLTLDPLWPKQTAFGYANSTPVSSVDPSGRSPKTCQQIIACLRSDPNHEGMPYSEGNACKCGKHSPIFKADAFLMLCVFAKECGSRDGKTIDPDHCIDDKGGGIGQITPIANSDLKRWCCNEGVDNPWDGVSVHGKNWCIGARIARNYFTCKGIKKYGPPYTLKQQKGIESCARCMWSGGPCETCFKHII